MDGVAAPLGDCRRFLRRIGARRNLVAGATVRLPERALKHGTRRLELCALLLVLRSSICPTRRNQVHERSVGGA